MADPNCWKCWGTGEHYFCLEYGCYSVDEETGEEYDNCYMVTCDCPIGRKMAEKAL